MGWSSLEIVVMAGDDETSSLIMIRQASWRKSASSLRPVPPILTAHVASKLQRQDACYEVTIPAREFASHEIREAV
jgi:hypothetical protein